MKSRFFNASGTRGRVRIMTLVVSGAVGLITLGAGLTWTAIAGPGVDENQPTIAQTTVDLDSLYAAKAREGREHDTSFVAEVEPARTIEGHVSWYGSRFHGRRTANGERFDMHGMSAAHKTLPFNTLVRVVDQATGKAVLVRINDRGPYVGSRVLDLSGEAAGRLGIKGKGTASGRIEIFPESSVSKTTRSVSNSESTSEASGDKATTRFTTFDADLQGVRPNGWSVQVASSERFDEAINLHDSLMSEFDDVFLTQIIDGGTISYAISLGVFNTEVLCRDFLVELDGRFEGAAVVHFQSGFPIPQVTSMVTADRNS